MSKLTEGRNRQQNTQPVIRGRKLVLNYTDGSPCPSPSDVSRRADLESLEEAPDPYTSKVNYTDSDPSPFPPAASALATPERRKTTIISLLCDRDPLNPPLTLSFVATPDECTYFFEARSSAACAGIEQAKQTLSPGGVFGVIAIIALLVYLVGGCVYSRTVLNQRGWRQLPNYSLWAGIFGFFRVRCLHLPLSCLFAPPVWSHPRPSIPPLSLGLIVTNARSTTGHLPHPLLQLRALPARPPRLPARQRRDRPRPIRP